MIKRIFLSLLLFSVIGVITSCSEQNVMGKVKLNTRLDTLGYVIGMNLGMNFKNDSINIDPDVFMAGLKDGLYNDSTMFTQQQAMKIIMSFQNEIAQVQTRRQRELGDKNQKIADEYLAENKTKPGVQTMESGLQYIVLKEGTGATPTDSNVVTVNYKGELINGKVFDNSYERGEPAKFQVNAVIWGWSEALKHMKEGAKWKLFIPPHMGYGPAGFQQDIPPNALLIFEVELLKVENQKPAQTK